MDPAFDVSQVITFAAIAVMGYCLWLVFNLKGSIPGGIVGKSWDTLLWLVGLFAVGYISTPFFNSMPESALRLLVACIFFFGAIYVLITVKLLYRVIQEVMD
ncbi:hypothetical protein [Thiohalomonas denitrificans]|uniref:hypothetical protein n=1 Tax=Thiohalomonas denitrificans TaxID=415747 RepID=UPI0026EE9B8B|nr:hypothetical protein [Thiohalomonas denitrificans]